MLKSMLTVLATGLSEHVNMSHAGNHIYHYVQNIAYDGVLQRQDQGGVGREINGIKGVRM